MGSEESVLSGANTQYFSGLDQQQSCIAPRLQRHGILYFRSPVEHAGGDILPCGLPGRASLVGYLLKHHTGHLAVVLLHESRYILALRADVWRDMRQPYRRLSEGWKGDRKGVHFVVHGRIVGVTNAAQSVGEYRVGPGVLVRSSLV